MVWSVPDGLIVMLEVMYCCSSVSMRLVAPSMSEGTKSSSAKITAIITMVRMVMPRFPRVMARRLRKLATRAVDVAAIRDRAP